MGVGLLAPECIVYLCVCVCVCVCMCVCVRICGGWLFSGGLQFLQKIIKIWNINDKNSL